MHFNGLTQDSKSKDIEHIIILSGDHLYRMDYMNFVQVLLYFTLPLFLLSSIIFVNHLEKFSNSCFSGFIRNTSTQMLILQCRVYPWMTGMYLLFFPLISYIKYVYVKLVYLQPCIRFWVDEDWPHWTDYPICRKTEGIWSKCNGIKIA